jgi:hypothetical protein
VITTGIHEAETRRCTTFDQGRADNALGQVCAATTSAAQSAAVLDVRIKECSDKKCLGPKPVKVKCGEDDPLCLLPPPTPPGRLPFPRTFGFARFDDDIYLCNTAFTTPCQLRNTILHEMLHTCYQLGEGPDQITHNAIAALALVFPIPTGCNK